MQLPHGYSLEQNMVVHFALPLIDPPAALDNLRNFYIDVNAAPVTAITLSPDSSTIESSGNRFEEPGITALPRPPPLPPTLGLAKPLANPLVSQPYYPSETKETEGHRFQLTPDSQCHGVSVACVRIHTRDAVFILLHGGRRRGGRTFRRRRRTKNVAKGFKIRNRASDKLGIHYAKVKVLDPIFLQWNQSGNELRQQPPLDFTPPLLVDNSSAASSIFNPRPTAGQSFAHSFYQLASKFLDADNINRISIRWCPSHCGIRGNERADRLAKQATSLSSTMATTRTNAIRRAKLAAQKEWTKEWRTAPHQGWFAVSDRLPPSLKPTKHARRLANNRELYGRVVQTRTGHGYTGEFRRRFALDEPYTCACDNITLETREHVLIHCPRFERWRDDLRRVSREIVLSDILGTDKGIEALETFLHHSKAFARPHGPPHPPDEPDRDVDNQPHPSDNG
ncbi:hypothetical protein NMY22_g19059 [Coprinellus aureogranulatus]|nr:hypothetical protein NMY22_g19059 [Coprinellus aureogranulatus]